MDKFKLRIRIFLWSLLTAMVAVLLYLGIVPFGKISYVYRFDKTGEFIGALTPKERVDKRQYPNTILGDPVYFTLHTPRSFESAVLHFKYKNKSLDNLLNPIIEVGPLVDKVSWRYDLRPVENKLIDSIALVWDKMTAGDLILLQKNKQFASVNEFLDALDEPGKVDLNKLAVYNYDLKTDYILNDYRASTRNLVIDKALRGSYQFYTYIDVENLDYTFEFVDINKNRDKDPVEVRLFRDNELVETRQLEDDGDVTDDGVESAVRKLNFEVADMGTGVYKMEVVANDDIVTKRIITKQNKLAFVNGIRLHDAGSKNITVFTDSKKIQSKTIYPNSLQTIKVGESDLAITETYKQFETVVTKALSSDKSVKIVLEKDGVYLNGNGVFSFSREALLNPRIKKMDTNADVKNDDIEYVLARYQAPIAKDGWKEASVPVDLRYAYREKGKYSFLVSIPGLKNDDNIDGGIILDEMRVDLTGWSIVSRIKNLFK